MAVALEPTSLPRTARRALCAGLLGAVVLATGAVAQTHRERYAPGELGGVTRVFPYTVARPDGGEVDYLLLQDARGRAPPAQVQVIAAGGEEVRLADVQAADCVLERVWLRTRSEGGAQIVQAQRTFSGDLKTDVQSDPAAMQVRVFRPARGEQPGDSAVQFRSVGPPMRTRPVCRAAEIDREMRRLASGMGSAPR